MKGQLSTLFENEAKESFAFSLKAIPLKVKSFYLAEYICNKWIFGNLEREYQNDSEGKKRPGFPIVCYLKLAKEDDICEEGMLFLEEIEEEKGISFEKGYKYVTDTLVAYKVNQYLTINFLPHAEGRCRIVKDVTEKLERVAYTKEKIVCL